jgi:putative two-component system response regulator
MHDLGKIGIPDSILRKPAGLTPEETAVMQLHTVVGAKMLLGSTSPVLQLASDIAVAHHEWWDGSGYPFGLSGPDIPESARIVAIVDVYDALTHDRVYRPALPETKVVQMIADRSGTQFDPRLVNVFMSVLPEMRAIALAVHDAPSEMVDLSTIECGNNACLTQASTAGK